MTAPVLAYKKFYIVKPYEQFNYIKNPTFASPDYEEDWAASGAGVTIAETGDYARRGAYSMKVNTATGVASSAYYANLSVTNGVTYAFSCDVLGTAGQAMRIFISDVANDIKATTTFTATGYWQRESVSFTAAETATTYYVAVSRDAVASTAPYYVDGCQFEHWKATTFFDGYSPGCRWTGAVRNSTSYRSANTGLGGELVDLSDYCEIVSVSGLGHGDWNQILTKMTSGGDMYQTHIRKSRQFSIVVDFIGSTLGAIETNRKAVIDMLRPDLLSNMSVPEQFGINWGADYRGHEQRIIRYQGFAANGDEATNPVDIVCVPLSASLIDTPDLPSHQRAVLNFLIPSGLLQGAYNEGKALDLYADFPAEFIVKRDPDGNWCKWGGSAYESLITGLNGDVYCMEEGPDGKIYVGGNFRDAGGTADADYLARWNPTSEAWEAVGSTGRPTGAVLALIFTPEGDLIVGGALYVKRYTLTTGAPAAWSDESSGTDFAIVAVKKFVISPSGLIYAAGLFTNAAATTNYGLAYSPYPSASLAWANVPEFEILGAESVDTITLAPNGNIIVGGNFVNLDGVSAADYLAKYDGTNVTAVSALNGRVYALEYDAWGNLYVGGDFTNAGGFAGADYIARWNGSSWIALGTGTNGSVRSIEFVYPSGLIVAGAFTTAGGLTLTDRVAVWSNGAWQPLDIDLPGTATINSALHVTDGSFYIGGAFSTAGETPDENAKTGVVALNLNVTSASANTYPFVQVTGPGTLKSITNYSTGKSISFDGLTLQAGEWIGLAFDPLNLKFRGGWAGRGNLMRYVIPGSDYGDFYLMPGNNLISLFMSGTTSASGATIQWKPLFWGLDGALL